MNAQTPCLQIRTYGTDGTTRMFTQYDSHLAENTLMKLNPACLFEEDTVKVADDDSETTITASELTRMDLITDRLSVWDFPFICGAPVEMTESEFGECRDNPRRRESQGWQDDISVFLEISMVNGRRYFFWLEVVGGLPAVRMERVSSIFKRQCLIFGLRTGGIGVLNLASMAHFSIYPEPPINSSSALEKCAT